MSVISASVVLLSANAVTIHGLASCPHDLGRAGSFRRQNRQDKATQGKSRQLEASPERLARIAERVALSCLHLPDVERQDVYCDITPLRGVTSQYLLTRLRLDADLFCKAHTGCRRLGRGA